MRLLNVDTYTFEKFFYADPPPYAILSHTWGVDSEEVSYRDVLDGRLNSVTTRPPKVTGCCLIAKKDGYQYVWIDTCCIDKTNSVELQEAINSVFRWYRDAAICYAYLSDVPTGSRAPRFETQDSMSAFSPGQLHHASVAQRMSWDAHRVTKRQEDIAYCLLRIFGIAMPMIYGEGDKAFRRPQEQIIEDFGDGSILAWNLDLNESLGDRTQVTFGTALAPAPSHFANSRRVVNLGPF
ncbi:heterokaryon incompatibility protein-domain-containing protein [Corynascus novoguineensis]|uniref:Heterokaryon incompatibility protein-domain-containing protein n=1 Tax=Corynascus novoguineensis TaxID=1126955 RepID=A0AAN7CWW8_9PEZI|nr:heterokaryon incompatibility protein-domain-containing protein [Corynascus novoguineensis]